MYVFFGSYNSVGDAQMDYAAVKQLYSDGVIDTYDAAVINQDADGNVHAIFCKLAVLDDELEPV